MNDIKAILFDPIKFAKKLGLSAEEVEGIDLQILRTLAAIGADRAIPILITHLGCFLWSEHLPARGPEFDKFIAELVSSLRFQIDRLNSDMAAMTQQANEPGHAPH